MTEPITIPAKHLASAIADAALFTSGDDTRPALQRVEVAADHDGVWLRATDSYALIERFCEPDQLFTGLPETRTVIALVHRDEAGLLVKMLKSSGKKAEAELRWGTKQSLRLEVEGRRYETERLEEPTGPPSFDKLDPGALAETVTVALGGPQLARLGKLADAKAHPILFGLSDPLRALRWQCGTRASGLVMPYRMHPEAASGWMAQTGTPDEPATDDDAPAKPKRTRKKA